MEPNAEKIINDINNSSSGLRDYNSLLHSEKEYFFKKKQKKMILLATIILVYTLISLTLLIFFKNKATDIMLWPLINTQKVDNYNALENKVNLLDKEVATFNDILSKSTQNNYSISYLNSKIEKIDSRQKSIESSISTDPEKALTSVLLREKQINIENSLLDLKNQQDKLNTRVDNFITTVLVGPIVTAILGFIIWILQSKFKKENS